MKLLKVKEVAVRIGVSERAIWKWTQTRKFPQPIRISRSVRWDESMLDAWIAEQSHAAQREATE
ncbi:MAG: AlpA family phage regulatory protein [Phycisphaerales bacterium]|nr:AlpA family phage regulatory protein [Phycisphaerales bacterium]MCB9856524.1 AlpA family phage regulatory protein [Phycisphaerales bacterium]